MFEIAVIGSISILSIGVLFIQNKTNRKKLEDEIYTLKEEIELKRELSARASLIEEENKSLKKEVLSINESVDNLKNTNTKKEILIAESNKDKESLKVQLNDTKKAIEKFSNEKIILNKSLEEANTTIIDHKNITKEKDYIIEQNEAIYNNNLANITKEKDFLSKEILTKTDTINKIDSKLLALTDRYNNVKIEESKLTTDLHSLKINTDETKLNLNNTINKLTLEIDEYKVKVQDLIDKNIKISSFNSKLTADLEAQESNNEKLRKEFEEQTKKFELKVGDIMQQALDSKLKKFDESSMKSLDETLKPFKENLELFRKKVEDTQESSTKKFAELSKEIEQVTKAGIHISKEAENLTQALKGKKQTQGSWGEMILETVLEYSGLLKGVHFETQESYKDESGDIKRPDVVIHLPQDRSMIIDSKVSLNDYDRYIRAETDEERSIASKGVAKAFKDQIDNLDSKDYSHYKLGTLQYVFMFVPVEGAFSLAVQEDPSLYEYALKKHIAIVNPSTLTVSLRTIYLYWQSEQSSTLAIKLFNEAGKLYDKMHTFTDNFAKIGSQLQTVNKTYENATKQLSEGSGNLLGRVANLKKLGARTSKSLSDSKIEYQDFDVDDVEVEIMDDNSHLYINHEMKKEFEK